MVLKVQVSALSTTHLYGGQMLNWKMHALSLKHIDVISDRDHKFIINHGILRSTSYLNLCIDRCSLLSFSFSYPPRNLYTPSKGFSPIFADCPNDRSCYTTLRSEMTPNSHILNSTEGSREYNMGSSALLTSE
jgi:hypothetical protein